MSSAIFCLGFEVGSRGVVWRPAYLAKQLMPGECANGQLVQQIPVGPVPDGVAASWFFLRLLLLVLCSLASYVCGRRHERKALSKVGHRRDVVLQSHTSYSKSQRHTLVCSYEGSVCVGTTY